MEPSEERFVASVLGPGPLDLFRSMPVADRRHGLDVVERLVATGIDDPDVLGAALLHDAAKGHRMRLWHRVAGVLLELLAPSILRRLADPGPASWRHPFHLYLHHEAMSAELARVAGASARLASFIDGSASEADALLLRTLKVADDAS